MIDSHWTDQYSEQQVSLRCKIVDLHKLGMSVGAISEQLPEIRLSRCVTTLEEDPNCHTQMAGNWLGCSGTTQQPPRLKPVITGNPNTSVTVQREFYTTTD